MRLEMYRPLSILTICLFTTFPSPTVLFSQSVEYREPKTELSKQPLTTDEIEIYQAVMKQYVKDSDLPLNVANKTYPLVAEDFSIGKECARNIKLRPSDGTTFAIHELDKEISAGMNLKFVDPTVQGNVIKEKDPSNHIRKSAGQGKKLSDDEIAEAVRTAFANGLFSLSEIVFDDGRRHAIVSYRFNCGMLCGRGSTLVFEKSGQKWNLSKRCSDWIA